MFHPPSVRARWCRSLFALAWSPGLPYTPLLLPLVAARVLPKRMQFVYCCFASWQHLRSYQDGYQIALVHTHGNSIHYTGPRKRHALCQAGWGTKLVQWSLAMQWQLVGLLVLLRIRFTRICSSGERQSSLNSGEISFRMLQEVEFLFPVSNSYPCWYSVGVMNKWERMQKDTMAVVKRCRFKIDQVTCHFVFRVNSSG